MKLNFKNKNILLTGGTRGIGNKLLEELVKLGANVYYTGRSIIKKNNFKRSHYLKLNFNSKKDIDDIAHFIDIKKIRIDILINNAGINIVGNLNKLTYDQISNIIDINLKNQIYFTKLIIKKMIELNTHGKIINISSIWGVITRKNRSVYTSSKHGLIGLTKSLAVDFAENGIIVNSVSPGFVNTELTKSTNSKVAINKIINQIPLRRLARTEEIAKIVIFLCSEYNTYITGQNIIIDGGYSIQ